MKHFIVLLFLSACAFINVSAQYFKYLNIENGLSSHRIYQIKTDYTGFMWFLTYKGIDRYDGSEVRNYKFTHNGITYENYTTFSHMETDRQGRIWVSLNDGRVYSYNKKLDDFELRINLPDSLAGICFLNSIYFDAFDRIWLSTAQGQFIYNLQNNNLTNIYLAMNSTPTCVINKNYNEYFIGTQNGVFTIRDEGNSIFSIVEDNKQTIHCGKVESLLYYNYKLYIGTESHGVHVLNKQSDECLQLNTAIPNKPIRSIKIYDKECILVGVDGGGVFAINPSNYQLIHSYIANDNAIEGLRGNTVYDILVDETKCIWVATYSNGITVIDPNKSDVKIIRHEYNNNNSLINNCVNVIFEDSDGDIWYGTNNGVSCYNEKEDKWKHFLNNMEDRKVILALAEDKKHRIWVGGYGIGVFYIDKKSGHVQSFSQNSNNTKKGIPTDYVYSIYAEDSTIWFGGSPEGLTEYNIDEHTFRYYRAEVTGSFIKLNDSIMFCGTMGNPILLNKKTANFRVIQDLGLKDIPTRSMRSLYMVNSENIWIGSEGNGLVCYNPQNGKIKNFNTDNGLMSNDICGIEGDDFGRLWFTTSHNLSYLDLQSERVVEMGEYLGLNNMSYNHHVAYKRKNGNIMFGSINGAVELSPSNEPSKVTKSKLIFTDFKLYYNSVKIGGDSPLQASIDETSDIKLTYNQNSFSFTFSSINFNYPNHVEYLYTLDGFDSQWFRTYNKMVNYTNINPGKYTFRLKAVDKDSKEVIEERYINIEIGEPFWASTWALLFYFILVLITIRFIVQYIKNKVDKQNSKDRIQFFINIAHDIRTPVALVKAPLSELVERKELTTEGKSILDIAVKNVDRLSHMISQLLDIQKTDMSALRLIVSKNELLNYLREKVVQFSVEASHKQQTLLFHTQSKGPVHVWFDREKMDRILNNLLSNAIKYTPEGGNIDITLTEDDKKWYISVKDSGIGIPQSEQKYLFKQFFRARNAINSKETGSGIGLLLTKKLVKLHHGEITFNSKEGTGTEFKLSFHKGNDYFVRNNKLEEFIMNEVPKVQVIEEEKTETCAEITDTQVKVMLAEDNEDMRSYLKNSLGRNYIVVEAVDGMEVLEKVAEENPDIIISDIMMPRLNGDAMCKILKASVETSHIPVILLSALTEKENIVKGLDDGADDYITKPFDISILKARIRNLLRNRQKIRDIVVSSHASHEEAEYISTLDKEFMNKIVHLIEERMSDFEFSINELCFEMAMSRSSLYNKLKAISGQAPNDFIRIIRLKKAAELLVTQQYNVMEVAVLTGFSDTKYFSTAFKKMFGQSPSKYTG
ncbi:ATP-binding protein [Bacteroides sp.]|uniref:hybrid sensor histidine kinase/response regulator n=1 Tax=Bacteroides sp. TaxID=29523 RepID=UPI0026101172|nr:ATP-binding protein [Bacteroides sp.]